MHMCVCVCVCVCVSLWASLQKGLRLNPITSLYYLSPLCFACLALPFAIIELPRLQNRIALSGWPVPPWMLLANASTALALNLSVFLLIGQTSALTFNVAGVVKDWLIILASAYIFGNLISAAQVGGYLFAFVGVIYYNQQRVLSKQQQQQQEQEDPDDKSDHEKDAEAGCLLVDDFDDEDVDDASDGLLISSNLPNSSE